MNKKVNSEKYFRAIHLEIMLCSKLVPLRRITRNWLSEITKYLLFYMYICMMLYTLSMTMLKALTLYINKVRKNFLDDETFLFLMS